MIQLPKPPEGKVWIPNFRSVQILSPTGGTRPSNFFSITFDRPTSGPCYLSRLQANGSRLTGQVGAHWGQSDDFMATLSDSTTKVIDGVLNGIVFEYTLMSAPQNGEYVYASRNCPWEGFVSFPNKPKLEINVIDATEFDNFALVAVVSFQFHTLEDA